MAKTWKDADISLDPIKDQTVAVIGYGIQGDAQANNMKDSGLKVIVGLKEGSPTWQKAKDDGHEVMSVADATKKADIVHILIPDMVQAKVYKEEIGPNLSDGKALSFSHAAAIYWKWIDAPENVDLIMVAPKGPGSKVRETYLQNFGTPSIVAVEQDKTGKAWDRTLGIAKAIGSARAGLIQTTFKEEVETDWFGEQADLCGGSASMVVNAFETLVEAGYQPEMAYFECLHELKLIVDLINESGVSGMRFSISETAKWGDVKVGPKIIDSSVKKRMKAALKDIQDGKFAKAWVREYKGGYKQYNKLLKAGEKHNIEKVGSRLRSMMPWMQKRTVKGAQAAY